MILRLEYISNKLIDVKPVGLNDISPEGRENIKSLAYTCIYEEEDNYSYFLSFLDTDRLGEVSKHPSTHYMVDDANMYLKMIKRSETIKQILSNG